jgi:hypothetical protein
MALFKLDLGVHIFVFVKQWQVGVHNQYHSMKIEQALSIH